MKRWIVKTLKAIALMVLVAYASICGYLYAYQESIIFKPEKLSKEFKFQCNHPYEEINIKAKDNAELNGLLFKVPDSKGLILFLHGNGGSIKKWGDEVRLYNNLNYDVFLLDYRGYGKSDGHITSEEQMYEDAQVVYDAMKKRYSEDKIILTGYSLGTGIAAKVASDNNPKMLLLHAPYASLTDLMQTMYPGIPTFLLKYKLETHTYVDRCNMPVVIFHGDHDEMMGNCLPDKLKSSMKPKDRLIMLRDQRHAGILSHPNYLKELKRIL